MPNEFLKLLHVYSHPGHDPKTLPGGGMATYRQQVLVAAPHIPFPHIPFPHPP